jgi:toxin ParE1/3/4
MARRMARRRATIVRPPRVRGDIVEIATYIAQDNPAAAERFLTATERTLDRLAQLPLSGRPYPLDHPTLHDVRMTPVRGFPRYLIFYHLVADELQLLRIVHGARDIPTLLGEASSSDDETN